MAAANSQRKRPGPPHQAQLEQVIKLCNYAIMFKTVCNHLVTHSASAEKTKQ